MRYLTKPVAAVFVLLALAAGAGAYERVAVVEPVVSIEPATTMSSIDLIRSLVELDRIEPADPYEGIDALDRDDDTLDDVPMGEQFIAAGADLIAISVTVPENPKLADEDLPLTIRVRYAIYVNEGGRVVQGYGRTYELDRVPGTRSYARTITVNRPVTVVCQGFRVFEKRLEGFDNKGNIIDIGRIKPFRRDVMPVGDIDFAAELDMK